MQRTTNHHPTPDNADSPYPGLSYDPPSLVLLGVVDSLDWIRVLQRTPDLGPR
jgi:hypothetical protein